MGNRIQIIVNPHRITDAAWERAWTCCFLYLREHLRARRFGEMRGRFGRRATITDELVFHRHDPTRERLRVGLGNFTACEWMRADLPRRLPARPSDPRQDEDILLTQFRFVTDSEPVPWIDVVTSVYDAYTEHAENVLFGIAMILEHLLPGAALLCGKFGCTDEAPRVQALVTDFLGEPVRLPAILDLEETARRLAAHCGDRLACLSAFRRLGSMVGGLNSIGQALALWPEEIVVAWLRERLLSADPFRREFATLEWLDGGGALTTLVRVACVDPAGPCHAVPELVASLVGLGLTRPDDPASPLSFLGPEWTVDHERWGLEPEDVQQVSPTLWLERRVSPGELADAVASVTDEASEVVRGMIAGASASVAAEILSTIERVRGWPREEWYVPEPVLELPDDLPLPPEPELFEANPDPATLSDDHQVALLATLLRADTVAALECGDAANEEAPTGGAVPGRSRREAARRDATDFDAAPGDVVHWLTRMSAVSRSVGEEFGIGSEAHWLTERAWRAWEALADRPGAGDAESLASRIARAGWALMRSLGLMWDRSCEKHGLLERPHYVEHLLRRHQNEPTFRAAAETWLARFDAAAAQHERDRETREARAAAERARGLAPWETPNLACGGVAF